MAIWPKTPKGDFPSYPLTTYDSLICMGDGHRVEVVEELIDILDPCPSLSGKKFMSILLVILFEAMIAVVFHILALF